MADSDKFKNPLAEPWAKLVHLLQQSSGYSHIIAAANSFGKNVMPRAAALLDVSPITDVTGISDSNTFVRYILLCSLFNLMMTRNLLFIPNFDGGYLLLIIVNAVNIFLILSESIYLCKKLTFLCIHFSPILPVNPESLNGTRFHN